MLYDRRWEKKAKTKRPKPSLRGLIAWLETKDPDEGYEFFDCEGACLVGQYMASLGVTLTYGPPKHTYMKACAAIFGGNGNDASVAIEHPRTFGGALRRARALQSNNKYVANIEVGGHREQAQTFEAGRSFGGRCQKQEGHSV
jgi:hypothetical protein